MMQLAEALRSGKVYLSESFAYRSPVDRVLPEAEWEKARSNAASDLGLPETWEEVLKELRTAFTKSSAMTVAALAKGDFINLLPTGKLKMRREKAIPEPESTVILRQLLTDRMRPIRIEDLLKEAQEVSGFMEAFIPPTTLQTRQTFPHEGLMACIIADGTNLGLLGMSRCTEGLSYDRLRRVYESNIRPETVREGSRHLVNAHNRMAITQTWGDGSLSSSDSQRFVIRRRSIMGAVYPRFAGFDNRMLGIYTHTSNTDDVLATQLVSVAEREAPYVIDGLYQNTSEIQPTAHTTDTHGYTERLFGLSFLLDVDFCPRIKNLAKAQLYRMGKERVLAKIEGLFSGSVNLKLIEEHWDELLRIALSIRRGYGTAQSLMRSLSGMMETDPVAKALLALGQLLKTIYILRYFGDPELRRNVQRQLNRGEERHQLARHIRFAHRGDFRTNNLAAILNQATCLSLLSNAVLLSNTRQIERIVRELEEEGHVVAQADLARISPLSFKNVIPHGTYRFFHEAKEVA